MHRCPQSFPSHEHGKIAVLGNYLFLFLGTKLLYRRTKMANRHLFPTTCNWTPCFYAFDRHACGNSKLNENHPLRSGSEFLRGESTKKIAIFRAVAIFVRLKLPYLKHSSRRRNSAAQNDIAILAFWRSSRPIMKSVFRSVYFYA